MALASEGLTTQVLNNHLKSAVLLAAFPGLLLGMMAAFFFILDLATRAGGLPTDMQHAQNAMISGLQQYGVWAFAAAGIWFVIAWFFHDSMIMGAAHAQPVTRQQMPQIYNIFENLCISRGIPMPQFEIIDSPALNAFASGMRQSNYKIVLTRGLVERLQPDELEGVIAHELTHIMNRDVRLLMVAVIFVGIFSFLAQLLFRLMVYGRPNYYVRREEGRRGGGIIIAMLIALAILAVGYMLALVIRFALSRKREYLADAGAITLTKNPDAMMRALQRISGQDRMPEMPSEIEQMCIENSHAFMGMFATHPPINDRIAEISRLTGTPIPTPTVSLRRGPRGPWEGDIHTNLNATSTPDRAPVPPSDGPWSNMS